MSHTLRQFAARAGAAVATVLIAAGVLLAGSGTANADKPVEQRTYLIQANTIKAFDETGQFNTGSSDEIFGGFRLTSSTGIRYNTQSRLFGNFDAGNTRTFLSSQACLGKPDLVSNTRNSWLSGMDGDSWTCHSAGLSAPFTLESEFYESDTPNIGACTPICDLFPVGAGPLSPRSQLDDGLGYQKLQFSPQGLAADIPTAGAHKTYPLNFTGSGANYRVTIQITRSS